MPYAMANCPKCKHEAWCHHQVTGKCETFQWIDAKGPYPIDIDGQHFDGVTYELEYGPPCECENPDLFMAVIKTR